MACTCGPRGEHDSHMIGCPETLAAVEALLESERAADAAMSAALNPNERSTGGNHEAPTCLQSSKEGFSPDPVDRITASEGGDA